MDLLSVGRWVENFLAVPSDRFEPGLFYMPVERVFRILASSVLVNEDPDGLVSEVYKDTFSRFHISHIGMSSFDAVTLLLLTDECGRERCVWRSYSEDILDFYLPEKEMEKIFTLFVSDFPGGIERIL